MAKLRGTRKPKHAKKTIGRVLSYISHGYKGRFLIVLLCILISAITNVISSLYIKTIIDDYITPMLMTPGLNNFGGLLNSILFMVGFFAFSILATFTSNYVMVIISQGVLRSIRNDLFKKMQSLPVKYFDTHTHGDIMSHYTNDTDALETMLGQSIPQIISAIITIISVFISMLYLSVNLTLISLLFLVVTYFVTNFLGKKSGKYFSAQQKTIGKTMGFVEEMINGQKVVKVFNHENYTKEDFDKINEELCYNSTKANKYANIFMPIMSNLSNFQYVVIAIIGGLMTIFGGKNLTLAGITGMGVGTIASFLQLNRVFNQPVGQMAQQVNSIVVALAGAERIFDLMDEEPEIDNGYITLVNAKKDKNGTIKEVNEVTNLWAWKDPTKPKNEQLTELKGDVRFFDVDFGYNDEKIVLHDISLYAKPGQKVAFVGSTGAGKTTITNLINRFYDIADGKIKYDGININKIKKADLRHSIGIVLQETNLFTGTVKENIRYGNLNATDEQVFEAAKLANADDFIQRLPQGYDTMINGDGSNLSQGQRQLISIARAAIANAPVMILDEATSSIDTHTERLVQLGMDALMAGRTVFVIAHRLSTVQNSNVIMVLENGKIIEKGTHEDLIKEKGKYYGLYTGKFELD